MDKGNLTRSNYNAVMLKHLIHNKYRIKYYNICILQELKNQNLFQEN